MPENSDEFVLVTTADTDIHAIAGELDLVRMKIDHNKWLITLDGRLLKADKVVSVWVPSDEERDEWKPQS